MLLHSSSAPCGLYQPAQSVVSSVKVITTHISVRRIARQKENVGTYAGQYNVTAPTSNQTSLLWCSTDLTLQGRPSLITSATTRRGRQRLRVVLSTRCSPVHPHSAVFQWRRRPVLLCLPQVRNTTHDSYTTLPSSGKKHYTRFLYNTAFFR